MTSSVDYIKKKLRGLRLSEDEIRSIVRDMTSGVLGEAEIAAFVAAQTSVGMDVDEIVSLTRAIVETGNVLKFDEPAYDIHSIGGVPREFQGFFSYCPDSCGGRSLHPEDFV